MIVIIKLTAMMSTIKKKINTKELHGANLIGEKIKKRIENRRNTKNSLMPVKIIITYYEI
jgi:hypothetical protein